MVWLIGAEVASCAAVVTCLISDDVCAATRRLLLVIGFDGAMLSSSESEPSPTQGISDNMMSSSPGGMGSAVLGVGSRL